MALLEAIFGGGQPKAQASIVVLTGDGIPDPETIAAISAGVVRAAIMAAVAATAVHVHGGIPTVLGRRSGGVWVTAGRLQLMGNRQR